MIEIKPAKVQDAAVLSEIARLTFLQTFESSNSKDDISLYLKNTFSEDKQKAEIQDPKRIIEIAWDQKDAIGFLHLYDGDVDPSVTGKKPIELLRLYLDSRFHGQGAGQLMMDRCLEIARTKGYQTLWLGVWEHNLKAQKFYQKYGFKKVGEHLFDLGHNQQNDYVLSLSL